MPNIKSAMKRDALSKAKNAKNKAEKSALKTNLKKFEAAVAKGDKEAAAVALAESNKLLDAAAGKGIIHRNTADRKKSRIAHAFNKLA